MSFKLNWPEGALRLADANSRCLYCRHFNVLHGDYQVKYVFPSGVFHVNCHTDVELDKYEFIVHLEDGVESTPEQQQRQRGLSAEVLPLSECTDGHAADDERFDTDDSLCDAHLAEIMDA